MTPKEISELVWSHNEQAGLVNIDTKDFTHVVMTKNEGDIKWLRDIKANLDAPTDPPHPLKNKLELVYRPEP